MSLILVTGHRGYIGSRLLPQLEREGHRAMTFLGDVSDEKDWPSNFAAEVPDVIIHMAAMNSLRECEANPARSFDVNYWSAVLAARYARIMDAKLIFTTTTTAGRFSTIYECDRSSAVRSIVPMRGLKYSILRLATVYGDSPGVTGRGRGIINSWVESSIRETTIKIYKEVADTHRHYVYVGDVVDNIIQSMFAPDGIYDVWHSERITMLHAATAIANLCDVDVFLTDAPKLYGVELRDEVLHHPVHVDPAYEWTPFAKGLLKTILASRKALEAA